MSHRTIAAILIGVTALAGCASPTPDGPAPPDRTPPTHHRVQFHHLLHQVAFRNPTKPTTPSTGTRRRTTPSQRTKTSPKRISSQHCESQPPRNHTQITAPPMTFASPYKRSMPPSDTGLAPSPSPTPQRHPAQFRDIQGLVHEENGATRSSSSQNKTTRYTTQTLHQNNLTQLNNQ